MPIASDTELISVGDWTVRMRQPASPEGSRLLLMLHGWTGDENVMWVFARNLPKDYWIITPRGPVPAPGGGFGWTPHHTGLNVSIDAFRPAVTGLIGLLEAFTATHPVESTHFNLIGFSQGTALSYALALTHPEPVERIAGIAGFMPEGVDALIAGRPLTGKRAFLAHGTQDETVPVENARRAVRLLEAAGAQVDYCEAEVGHKLSADCFRGIEQFMK